MTDRTNELRSAVARARAGGSPIASASQGHNTPPHRPAVTIRTYDGLAVDTQVEYAPDGSVVVSIYKHRPALVNGEGSTISRTRDAHRHRHLDTPVNVLGGFVARGDGPEGHTVNPHGAARAGLPRSNRVWDFGNPTELHEMNAVNPTMLPPTYEEATVRPPPPYDLRGN
jgi:hypothetical protein